MSQLQFTRLVFGGGGARCFWEAGVADVLNENAELDLKTVCAVSGGAVVAASFLAGNLERLLKAMRRQFSAIDHNLRWSAFASEKSLFPHCRAYHRAIEESFDSSAIDHIRSGPKFWVQIARPPKSWSQRLSIAVGSAVHEAERLARNTPHGRWLERMGYCSELIDVRRAETGGELAEIMIASGCIPPFIPLQKWAERPALDGSILDNAPIGPDGEEDDATLVLVTRRYSNLPEVPGRTYLRPSSDMPAHKLDFTDADAVSEAYEMGRKDAREFIRCR